MPGERKNKTDRWMPPRVYKGRSGYELHPKSGGSITIAPLTATQAEVWAAFEKLKDTARVTVSRLATGYFQSKTFLRKRPRTQRDYESYWEDLKQYFSGADATRILPKHVRKWMDQKGRTGEVIANRQKALLSNLFAWGIEYGLVKLNPCWHVKDFPEDTRDYYIEDYGMDGEDRGYYDVLEQSRVVVQIFMEISYLCMARGQDVRMITLSDIRENGIFIQQGKTRKKQIKKWTPRLRDAVKMAQKLRADILEKKGANVLSPYLILTRFGQPYSESGLKSIWAKNKKNIEGDFAWTFHDIKAKGISDYEGDISEKQTAAGHKSRGQTENYNRKPEQVNSLESEFRPLKEG